MITLLKNTNHWLGQIEKFLIAYSTIGLATLTVGNVISRKIFDYSWSFTEEISQFILVLITFLSVSYGARKARHICMTALFEALNQKWQKIFIVVSSLTTAAILFYLAFYASEYVISTYQMSKTTPVLRIPFYLGGLGSKRPYKGFFLSKFNNTLYKFSLRRLKRNSVSFK